MIAAADKYVERVRDAVRGLREDLRAAAGEVEKTLLDASRKVTRSQLADEVRGLQGAADKLADELQRDLLEVVDDALDERNDLAETLAVYREIFERDAGLSERDVARAARHAGPRALLLREAGRRRSAR